MADIEDVLKRIKDKISSTIRVCIPGVISKYDHKTQKAEVKVDIQELFEDDTSLESPVIPGVPVIMPCSGGAFFSMPVKPGDFCLVVVCDRDISNWLLGASNQKPNSRRKHNITDAVAIMGLRPFTKTANIPNNTDVIISYANSTFRILADGTIDIDSKLNVNVKSKSNININSAKNLNLHSDEISVKCVKSVKIECADADIKASGNVKIECSEADIKASGNIKTSAVLFEHKGDIKVSGNLDLSGSGNIGNGITCKGGINNTGGQLVSNNITLETHTHTYQKGVTAGGSPVVNQPDITGTPT